jgi:hypothetical protein
MFEEGQQEAFDPVAVLANADCSFLYLIVSWSQEPESCAKCLVLYTIAMFPHIPQHVEQLNYELLHPLCYPEGQKAAVARSLDSLPRMV